MAILPSAQDLGQVDPGSGERPIGQANAAPIGAAYQRLGQGLNQLGEGVASFDQLQAVYQNRLATSGALSELLPLEEQTQRDTNYGPDANGQNLKQRYVAAAQAIRDKWAGSISSGPMRNLFIDSVNRDIAEGAVRADAHSFQLQGDHNIAAADTVAKTLNNTAMASDDPTVHARAMDAVGAQYDALASAGYITQEQAFERKQKFGENLAVGLRDQQALNGDPLGAYNGKVARLTLPADRLRVIQ